MHLVEFEPAIPAFEGAKTVHSLDCAATVIGSQEITQIKFCQTKYMWTLKWPLLKKCIDFDPAPLL
jgi:hypothetical protein